MWDFSISGRLKKSAADFVLFCLFYLFLNDARANMISAGFSNIHFAPSGISSMEEECEVMPYRSGDTDKHERARNTQEERDRQTITRVRTAAWAQVPTRPG